MVVALKKNSTVVSQGDFRPDDDCTQSGFSNCFYVFTVNVLLRNNTIIYFIPFRFFTILLGSQTLTTMLSPGAETGLHRVSLISVPLFVSG